MPLARAFDALAAITLGSGALLAGTYASWGVQMDWIGVGITLAVPFWWLVGRVYYLAEKCR